MRPETIIRRYLRYKGWSYSTLALKASCSWQYIQQIDQGIRNPNVQWCKKLEQLLDIPPGDLYMAIAYPTPDLAEFDRITDEQMSVVRPRKKPTPAPDPVPAAARTGGSGLDADTSRGVAVGGPQTPQTVSGV